MPAVDRDLSLAGPEENACDRRFAPACSLILN
jgi:hypothetical protein